MSCKEELKELKVKSALRKEMASNASIRAVLDNADSNGCQKNAKSR